MDCPSPHLTSQNCFEGTPHRKLTSKVQWIGHINPVYWLLIPNFVAYPFMSWLRTVQFWSFKLSAKTAPVLMKNFHGFFLHEVPSHERNCLIKTQICLLLVKHQFSICLLLQWNRRCQAWWFIYPRKCNLLIYSRIKWRLSRCLRGVKSVRLDFQDHMFDG